jgi:SAM-dependent methyltransferase
MELWPVLKGVLTRVPGLYRPGANAKGGSIEARYCYAVWGRHLARWQAASVPGIPRVVAELGPGLSFGVGIAALLSGACEYLALDVSRDAKPEVNARLVDELAALFAARAPLPGPAEYPRLLPVPSGEPVLPPFNAGLREIVHRAIAGDATAGPLVQYVVPWSPGAPPAERADVVLAQAVLEHVDDPIDTCRAIARLLRPGGLFSFTVDCTAHGLTRAWNGHLAYPASTWRVVRGARRWTINRLPLSAHLAALSANGFDLLVVERELRDDGLNRGELAAGHRDLTDEDLCTAGAYVLARKAASRA